MTETIKTRFAPSPSGYLHLGGARTALFAWAFARRGGGEFLLRIEDTDAARSDDRHSRAIAESLQWLGLQFDGDIAYQSRRRARHLEIAAQLSRGDDVFEDGGALRLRTPDEGETAFDDLVCGRLAVQNRELENPVLVRADKTPTYIFASAADDMDGGITHVIRGDDHIRNTHKQLHLYRALQKTPPHFAHLPMILGEDGARLSKRNAAVDVLHYRREGFLSRALMNYLARLSWSHGDAEKFDSDFLIRNFDFAKVSRSPAKFDLAKLKWLNGEHLRELPRLPQLPDSSSEKFLRQSQQFINSPALEFARKIADTQKMFDSPMLRQFRELQEFYKSIETLRQAANPPTLEAVRQATKLPTLEAVRQAVDSPSMNLVQGILSRSQTMLDAEKHLEYLAARPSVPAELLAKHIGIGYDAMVALSRNFDVLPSWHSDAIKESMKATALAHRLKFPQIAMPLRIMLTGKEQSPDIAQVAEALGKEETAERMNAAINPKAD